MSHKLSFDASFCSLLIEIDRDIAAQIQLEGCTYCGGLLHQSAYPRSPFGLSARLRTHFEERFSFCCATCRKRTTPPSVRFFGRRWFPAPLLVLVSLLRCGINERRLAQVRRHFGINVSITTWKRWRRWWRDSFAMTRFWQRDKGLVPLVHHSGPFPRALLDAFQGGTGQRMCLLLKFISPLTGGNLRAV